FPENYGNAEISGKPVEFDVTLHKLYKKNLPELNDELAKQMGDYENLEALTNIIRKDLEAEEEGRIKEEFKSRLLKELVKQNPVDVPEKLKAQQKAAVVADVEKRLRSQGLGDAEV